VENFARYEFGGIISNPFSSRVGQHGSPDLWAIDTYKGILPIMLESMIE
jgi:hypothetical protein